MTPKTAESFFTRMRQKFFTWRINREIFERISSHLEKEKDFGYPFETDEEMNALTKTLDVQILLNIIEGHIRKAPKAYGAVLRYIIHRDLHERFKMYERVARRAVPPKECDPRFVATRYEPSH